MNAVSIHLPTLPVENYVEVDVTVNGKKRHYKYRVEIFEWEKWCPPGETRAVGIRKMLESYDPRWQLVEIGSPTETAVPLMFRKRQSESSESMH